MHRLLAWLTLCVLCLTVGVGAQTSVQIPLDVHAWTKFKSPKLTNTPDGSLRWNLNGARYVFTKPVRRPTKKKPYLALVLPSLEHATTLVITARIVTKGAPVFLYGFGPDNPCPTPASAHPLMWAEGYDWYDPYARWWGHVPIWLATGRAAQTFRVPLTPDVWSSVYGTFGNADAEAAAGWQHMLEHPGSVGLTFGGGCFYGHSVTVEHGTAHFELMDVHVE